MTLALPPPQLEAIKAACMQYQVQLLHLFGSALRADFNPNNSDLDLLVECRPIKPTKLVRACFDLDRQLTAFALLARQRHDNHVDAMLINQLNLPMDASIGVFKAKSQLSRLLLAVEQGEPFTITVRGKPVDDLLQHRSGSSHGVAASITSLQVSARIRGVGDIDVASFVGEGRL